MGGAVGGTGKEDPPPSPPKAIATQPALGLSCRLEPGLFEWTDFWVRERGGRTSAWRERATTAFPILACLLPSSPSSEAPRGEITNSRAPGLRNRNGLSGFLELRRLGRRKLLAIFRTLGPFSGDQGATFQSGQSHPRPREARNPERRADDATCRYAISP